MLDPMIEQHAAERRAADLARVAPRERRPGGRPPGRFRSALARSLASAAGRLDPQAPVIALPEPSRRADLRDRELAA